MNRLLSDLHEAFLEDREADCHIGILSVAPTSDDSARFDLIDGQQRITSLMLVGMAAKSHFGGWSQFIESDRLDLYGRDEDKLFLKGEAAAECNRRMVDAVRCTTDFFNKQIKEEDARRGFAEYIYRHAAFFLSQVPSSYSLLDKNQQFVRMNNRGKQLEKHEILKTRLLSKIKDDVKQTGAFKIWNDMVTCLTGIEDSHQDEPMSLRAILESKEPGSEPTGNEVLYTSMITIPEFLLLGLVRYLKPGEKTIGFFNTDKLLETFSVLKEAEHIIAFTKVLEKQVDMFRSFFIFLSKQEKYEFGGKSDTEDKDFDFTTNPTGKKRLIAVQSFLHVSTEPHHWIIPAFDWSESQARPLKSEDFIERLEAIDNAITRNEIRRVVSFSDPKNMEYRSVNRYWFYRLDYELWKRFHVETHPSTIWSNLPKEKAIRDLVENFRFRRGESVEHIVPLTTIDGPENKPPDHSFGNLALISRSANSKFSNNPPEGKRAMILQTAQPYTESLKMLHFLWCYPKPDPISHGEAMFGILKEIADTENLSI